MKATIIETHNIPLVNKALRKDTDGRSILSQRCKNLLKDRLP
jgi:hypothetical protein